jgi:hypothetical protein
MRMIIELNDTITLKGIMQLRKSLKESGVDGDLVKHKEEKFILELSFTQDISIDILLNIVEGKGNIILKKSNIDEILERINIQNPFAAMASDLEKMGLVKKGE